MNYRETDHECGGCGSTAADRDAYGQRNMGSPRGISECPHCSADKCVMCDMGDDVECGNCDTGD